MNEVIWFRTVAHWLMCQQAFVTKDYQDVGTKHTWPAAMWTEYSWWQEMELKYTAEDELKRLKME